MAKLQPYPAYKESDVKWLGEVPAHWETLRIKRLARINPPRSEISHMRDSTDTIVFLPMECVSADGRINSSNRLQFREAWQGLSYFRRGDVIVAKITPCFENGKGAFLRDLETEIGFGSTEFIVLRPSNEVFGDYLYYLTKSVHFRSLGAESMTGAAGQQRVPPGFVANFIVPVPHPEEQQRISRFLRKSEIRINRFVRNRRRLIELLNEQKQAIINQAVIRGLDPHVPLKPSGIEWLGDIPKHWQMLGLKRVAKVQTGITLGKNYSGQRLEERPYLRVANVQVGRVDLRTIKTVAVPQSEIVRSELKPGDVLMTEGGDIDKLGRGCVWQGEIDGCLHQNHIFAVRVNHTHLVPYYLVALMASVHGRAYFQLTAKQTTNLASTNATTLKAFSLPLPPLPEQRRILDWIQNETELIVAALERAKREIDLIREYRTRLIADVVTGKVDVRHLAPSVGTHGEHEVELDDVDELIDEEIIGELDEEVEEEVAYADD